MLSGCGSTGEDEESDAAAGRELTIEVDSHVSETLSFDPATDYVGYRSVTMGITERLFRLNADTQEIEPELAVSCEQADDTTWIVTVRDGVTFSNGKMLDAGACKDALEYILENNTRIGMLADVGEIEAQGQTLTIRTRERNPLLPNVLTDEGLFIFDTEAEEYPDYADGVIGTGPYILESMDRDGNCELVRNDNYWQGTPQAERIHTKWNLDSSARTLALQSGELDYAQIQTSDVVLFEDDENYTVLPYNSGRVYFLYLNENYSFTKDPALREALTCAFDREAIVNGVYSGCGEAAVSIFPSYSDFYDPSVSQEAYDPDRARQILDEAGYVDTDGDGYLEKDGEKVTLDIVCYASNNFPVLSEVLQSFLKEIGIDSQIVISDAITEDLSTGEFHIATYAYNTLTLGDCYNYLEPVFHSGGSANFSAFSDPQVDALLEELKVTADAKRRAELAVEIQKEIYESDDYVFLLHIYDYYVAKSNVTGYEAGNSDVVFDLWKLKKNEGIADDR